MPAPTFTISQTIPTCVDTGGLAVDETNLDRGNVEVHAGCCRYYGTSVVLSGFTFVLGGSNRTLHYEGTVDTCNKTGTGAKTFSGDAFKLCGGNGAAFTASHTGTGTVVGAAFTGSGSGTASGGRSGPYTITIAGTLTGPTDGSFTGTVAGALSGTLTGTIVAGVISVTYTMTDSRGGSATGGGTFSLLGGGPNFVFSGSLSGTNAAPLNAYWSLVWTNCSTGGIVAQLLNDADDSLIAEYCNERYCLKSGRRTILNRRSVECAHPCLDYESQAVAHNRHPAVICFSAGMSMTTCNGSLRDKEYTGTIGTPAHEVTAPMMGLTDTGAVTVNSGNLTLGGSGNDTPDDFAITGSMTWSGNFTTGVTLTFTFTSAGDWNASATVKPCSDPFPSGAVASAGIQWGGVFFTNPGGTVTITGGTGGVPLTADMLSPNRPTSVVLLFQSTSTTGFTFPHDYCSGSQTGSAVGPIRITGTVTTAGGTVSIDFTSDSTTSVPFSVTQSGDAYP